MPTTWAGQTVITEAEGAARLKPGTMKKIRSYVRLVHSEGELVKILGRAGADHRLTICFDNVLVANVTTIMARMESLQALDIEGTLSVPEYGTYPHCMLDDVIPDEQTRTVTNLAITPGGGLSGSASYEMRYELIFHQLRK